MSPFLLVSWVTPQRSAKGCNLGAPLRDQPKDEIWAPPDGQERMGRCGIVGSLTPEGNVLGQRRRGVSGPAPEKAFQRADTRSERKWSGRTPETWGAHAMPSWMR